MTSDEVVVSQTRHRPRAHETGPSTPRRVTRPASGVSLLMLPALVVLALLVAAWVSGVSNAGFWADDFTNMTLYGHSVGDLTDTARNDGKYTINVAWWLGTVAFGTGSALPYLLMVSLVSVLGVWLWLRSGVPVRWGSVQAWWVAAAWAATATPLGIMLWSSNIVHAVSLLCLGVALAAHGRAQRADATGEAVAWSSVGAFSWLVLIVSNPLYLGVLLVALVLVLEESAGWIRRTRWGARGRRTALVGMVAAHIGVPSAYFLLVAFPRTTSRSSYSAFGLSEIPGNVAYYVDRLAPTWWSLAAYAGIFVAAAAVVVVQLLRRDLFPAALLISAAGVTVPVLMQGQQRADHYLAVPALLVLSALAAGTRPRDARAAWLERRWVRVVGILASSLALFALFDGSSAVRGWWTSTPLGAQIAAARDEIAQGTASGAALCVELDMDEASKPVFVAGMGGAGGLQLDPVLAGSVEYVDVGECPVGTERVRVSEDSGEFRAVVDGQE